MPTYPGIAEQVLDRCRGYRNGSADLQGLKEEIWSAASLLSVPEDRALREFLQQAEGRLDMIQFTVNGNEVERAALAIVEAIEARLVAYLGGPNREANRPPDLHD